MPDITLIISDADRQTVRIATTAPLPAVGRLATPAEDLAADVLRMCRNYVAGNAITYSCPGIGLQGMVQFLRRVLDREGLAWAVTDEVRAEAAVLLRSMTAHQPELLGELRGTKA